MLTVLLRRFGSWFLLIAVLLCSCAPKSTPPGANSIGGAVDGANYSYHYWEEGLAFLIWHDFSYGAESCTGTGSTEDPVYRLECGVEAQDGRRFSWEVHTGDGLTADMWINNQSIDLSQGKMFLVSLQDGGVDVVQLQRDFSELEGNYETIADMASSDPDVANLVESAQPTKEPTGEPADNSENSDAGAGLSGIIIALREMNHSVELAGQADQPFFSVPGQIVAIDGEDVQIFEFPDVTQGQAEAAQISPDAGSVGTTIINWVGTPRFYSQDRLIVLYVGENEAVISALNQVLGEPIAEGQAAEVVTNDEPIDEATPSDVAILAALEEALVSRDFPALEELMGDPFTISYWRSQALILTPARAVEQLRLNLLPDPGALSFIRDQTQFPDLGGQDPAATFGPDVHIVDLVYSQGWGG